MRRNASHLILMCVFAMFSSAQAASTGGDFLVSSAAGGAAAQGRDAPTKPGALNFTPYEVTDPNFGGMRVSTLAIPAGWRASSQVQWDFSSANYPVRVYVRVQSPDGKMWIDLLPMDAVYWLDRTFGQPIPAGQRSFGAVYAPNATIDQAMQHLVVLPARGRMPGFQITARRPVDAARLAQAFGKVNWRGEAMSMRARYTLNGSPVEEDFFTFYTAMQTIPYTGPQGTSHEFHRMLLLSHAVGACANVMKEATNLDLEPGKLRPGIGITTSPTDYRPIKQLTIS